MILCGRVWLIIVYYANVLVRSQIGFYGLVWLYVDMHNFCACSQRKQVLLGYFKCVEKLNHTVLEP